MPLLKDCESAFRQFSAEYLLEIEKYGKGPQLNIDLSANTARFCSLCQEKIEKFRTILPENWGYFSYPFFSSEFNNITFNVTLQRCLRVTHYQFPAQSLQHFCKRYEIEY